MSKARRAFRIVAGLQASIGLLLFVALLWGGLGMRPRLQSSLDAACLLTNEFSVSLADSAARLAQVQSIVKDIESIVRSSQDCAASSRDSATSMASVAQGWQQRTEGAQSLMRDTRKSLDRTAGLMDKVPVLKMLSPAFTDMAVRAGEYEKSMQETRELLGKITVSLGRDAAGSLDEVKKILPELAERICALRRNCEQYRKSIARSSWHAAETAAGLSMVRRYALFVWALMLALSVGFVANGLSMCLLCCHVGSTTPTVQKGAAEPSESAQERA